LVDILTFDGFFGAKFDILTPRWLPTAGYDKGARLGFPNVPSIAEQCGGAHRRARRIGGGRDHVTTRNEKADILLNKVPEVTMIFWIIKIMSTTVGETGADYLAVHIGLGTAVTGIIMAALLIVALVIQLRTREYTPWIYWLTVVLVSVVGTQITDALTDRLDVSLYTSTEVFAAALAVTFAVWYWLEGTLSIHTIVTTRRELFYWAAILFTFALGTAAGDLATEALSLGFTVGVVAFGAGIAIIALAYSLGANAVLTFWLAYILTRPLGASLGDLLSQSRPNGGVGLGTITTSIVFLAVITTLVVYLTFSLTQTPVPAKAVS
jgi:uncharacterized membrane-anchored protein